jgi:hypothetical protein
MNRIICHWVEYVFSFEIESMSGTGVVLKPGVSWRRLEATEKPVYVSGLKRREAGPDLEETVSVQTHYDPGSELRRYAAFYYVLRLRTDTGTFYCGTPAYPSTLEITTDRVFDSCSFRALSPAV